MKYVPCREYTVELDFDDLGQSGVLVNVDVVKNPVAMIPENMSGSEVIALTQWERDSNDDEDMNEAPDLFGQRSRSVAGAYGIASSLDAPDEKGPPELLKQDEHDTVMAAIADDKSSDAPSYTDGRRPPLGQSGRNASLRGVMRTDTGATYTAWEAFQPEYQPKTKEKEEVPRSYSDPISKEKEEVIRSYSDPIISPRGRDPSEYMITNPKTPDVSLPSSSKNEEWAELGNIPSETNGSPKE